MASPHIVLRNDQFSQITHQPIARLQIQDKKVILITSLGRLIKTEPCNFHPSLWSKVELINRMHWHVVQWDDGSYQVKWSLRILGGGADQSKEKEKRKAALVKELGLSEQAAELFYEHLYIQSKPSDPKKFSERIITACSTEYFIEHPDDQVLVLKILIEKFGADPNHEDEIFTSGMQRLLKYCKHKEPVEYMINHGALLKEEFAPLHRALKMGWLDTFQLMLQRGANVNECKFKATYTVYGKRILHSIIKKGSVEFLKTLLAYPNIEANSIDEEGCTPLIRACEKEERHVHLPLLLSLSVDFRVCDEADRTALITLVESSSPEGFQKALDLLHKHGFKLNAVVIGSITQISYCLTHFVFSDLREHENSPWKNNSIMKNIEIMLKQKEVIEQLPFEIYMVLPSAIHTMVQAALVADKRDLQKELKIFKSDGWDVEALWQQFVDLELLILLDGGHHSQRDSCFLWLREKGAESLKQWKEEYKQQMGKQLEEQNQKLLQEREERWKAKQLRKDKKHEEWRATEAERSKEITKRLKRSILYVPPDPPKTYIPMANFNFRQWEWDIKSAAQKAQTYKPFGVL